MTYKYRYCGLTLASNRSFPELEAADFGASPDVQVRDSQLGSVPNKLEAYGPNWAISREEAWWWLEGKVTFRIRPRSIDIDQKDCGEPLVVALLLEAPMVILMIFRGTFCLNAASVSTREETIVFCGAPASGRSTAAAKLVLEGASLLTDSVAPIDISLGAPRIVPQGSGLLLWPDAMRRLGMQIDSGSPIRGESKIRRIHLASQIQPQGISKLYWRNPSASARDSLYDAYDASKDPTVRQRFARLATITAGRLWIDLIGQTSNHFRWCLKIAQECSFPLAPTKYFDWK